MAPIEGNPEMQAHYQSWAEQNYGDTGKTKTVTKKKYHRILCYLRGDESPTTENAKFRFWIKGKGFKLSPANPDYSGREGNTNSEDVLYVPVKTTDADGTIVDRGYKRVAIVEEFFNIIYNVHVETDGRGGKHAGQKRTYKAIAETYAFLPREAVTRFLMNCNECQKRMHLSPSLAAEVNGYQLPSSCQNQDRTDNHGSKNTNHSNDEQSTPNSESSKFHITDYSLPITTTYLSQLRNMRLASSHSEEIVPPANKSPKEPFQESPTKYLQDDISLSSADTEASEPSAVSESGMPTGSTDATMTPTEAESQPLDLMHKLKDDTDSKRSPSQGSPPPDELRKSPKESATHGPSDLSPKYVSSKASPVSHEKIQDKDLTSRPAFDPRFNASNGFSFGLTGASSQSSENARDTPEDLSVTKDDDDDDDGDDDSDKLNDSSPPGADPERLKAFNMFVRLFIDENLDRMVPISKQPKEKIQAIIEACYRQFPDYHERARKRIRTYLKSCRRMKRHRDQNGLDSSLRPTPPHLTSARAEHILAAACESESENAKRLRMELMQAGHTNEARMDTHSPQQPQQQQQQQQPSATTRVYEESTKHSPRPVDYRFANGVNSHDPYYGSIAPHHASMLQPSQHAQITNGPTDLSVKKMPSSKTQLSPTEVANIRQLITSYRESAAFLYRSADELEQMLLQLN